VRAVQRGESSNFDNRIEIKPGVVSTLARFHGIVRGTIRSSRAFPQPRSG
jgi:hypothetical protein